MELINNVFIKKFFRVVLIFTLFVVVIMGLSACTKNQDKEVQTSSKKEPYTIVKKDDISLDKIKRYVYTVVINSEAKKSELEKIANEIIEKAKSEGAFNGIQILMYDGEYAALGDEPPSLGKYTYAPEGDFAKAMDINAGDYSNMKSLNELKEANWKLRPSEDTQKIISMYNELFKKESEKNSEGIINEEDIRNKTAELMGISVQDVDDALVKLDEWIWHE
ncbi:hypothetical protein [Clostridium cylindrosporum]|uniref:Uncharacterized protein n=1 Tax=Clostridium cylindrosporum DSM 605 TaxID=1121307 RepID=A0A0J8DBH8_CLOCY|nr:hypothetical protein [Clostridium cylindrosporum]KMT21669.1 hypothetical protein CLCY_2c04310 [Clostridium cylindrosporum DSM 605]